MHYLYHQLARLDSCQHILSQRFLFHRICKKAGISVRGQHALRHTFATRCIEADVPPVVLKKWLGHKDIHMTLDIYADVFDSMHNSAMEKFEGHVLDMGC